MEFHEKLQHLRKQKGLTQEELASELYISRPGISNYESGTRTPDVAMLRKLCDKFGVSMNYLMGNISLSDEIGTLSKTETNIKQYLTNGKLDLSDAPPLVKIIVVEFYLYLMTRYQ